MNRLLLLSAILLGSAPTYAASFDCEKAEHPEEKAICGNPALSQLDSNISLTYVVLNTECTALATSKKIGQSQGDWLKQTRSQFKSTAIDVEKLKATLEQRSQFLNSMLADCGRESGKRLASLGGSAAIDMRSGRLINIEELFTDLGADQLDALLRKSHRETAEAYLEKKVGKEFQDDYDYMSCLEVYIDSEIWHFERWTVDVSKSGDLSFRIPKCSSRQTHDDIEFPPTVFLAKELKPYLNEYGRSLLLGEGQVLEPIRPLGKCSIPNAAKQPFQPAAIASGEDHSLLLSGGKLWAWGRNSSGQLGAGEEYMPRDKLVLVGEGYISASASQSTSAAIRTDGSLWTWGANGLGKLADVEAKTQQRLVKIGNNFVEVELGYPKAIALQRDGTLWLWDGNKIDKTPREQLLPEKIASGVKQIKFGPSGEIIALKKDGSLVTHAGYGPLGPYPDSWQTIGSGFASLGSGKGDDLAFKTDGSVWVWGDLANLFANRVAGPHRLPAISIGQGFTKVSSLYPSNFIAALKSDGSLWGTRYRTQKGLQIEPQSCGFVDVEVIGGPGGNRNDVAAVGVRSNGELVMWGNWNMDSRWTPDRRMFSSAPRVIGNYFVKLYRTGPKWGGGRIRLFAQKLDGSIWELENLSDENPSDIRKQYVPTMKIILGI